MYRLPLIVLLITASSAFAQTSLSFKTNQVDTMYGKAVYDPYRSLEDTGNAKVKSWMKEQSLLTEQFFASIPGRKKLYDEIVEANSENKFDEISMVRFWKGKFYVTKRKTGQENYSLYEIDAKGKEKLLIDPLTVHPEIKSSNVMLSYFTIFKDRAQLLYMLTIGGNESDPKLLMRDMITGSEKFDTAYLNSQRALNTYDPDRENGFYYDDMPLFKKEGTDPMHWNDSTTLRYHVIGTPGKEDKIVIGVSDPIIKRDVNDYVMFTAEKSLAYAFANVKNKVANEYRIYTVPRKDLHKEHIPWQKVTDFEDKVSQYVVKGDYLYLLSNKDAGNSKVLRVDLRNPSIKNATLLFPPSKTILTNIDVTKNELVITALDGGKGRLFRIAHGSTRIDTIPMPLQGKVELVWCDRNEASFIVDIHSWTRLQEYFSYNPVSKKLEHSVIQQKSNNNTAPIVVKEVMVKSYDGVEVPMTIVYKKGLILDGTHPIVLNGYGAYGIQDDPSFWPESIVWFNRGGIRAYAHIRGGGAYGEEWHVAGQKTTKPNTWKDFIACAEYLIKNKYATTKTLTISGGSAGGITIGRAITERPDLFGSANIAVGALDMVRFETTPNGAGNVPEFGSVKTEDGFKALYEMSAYHHVKNGVKYPAVIFTHGVNDTRVPVWTSLKMAAKMQEATTSGRPIFLKLNFDSGHGMQQNISTILSDAADNYAWCFWQADIAGFQPVK
jgi:prolyl oligopeptidase